MIAAVRRAWERLSPGARKATWGAVVGVPAYVVGSLNEPMGQAIWKWAFPNTPETHADVAICTQEYVRAELHGRLVNQETGEAHELPTMQLPVPFEVMVRNSGSRDLAGFEAVVLLGEGTQPIEVAQIAVGMNSPLAGEQLKVRRQGNVYRLTVPNLNPNELIYVHAYFVRRGDPFVAVRASGVSKTVQTSTSCPRLSKQEPIYVTFSELARVEDKQSNSPPGGAPQ